MSTGQSRARMYNKKVMPLEAFRELFLEYLIKLSQDTIASVFKSPAALGNLVPVTAVGNNMINVAAAASRMATDGLGNLLIASTDVGDCQNVAIPADAGVAYDVGLRAVVVESGVERNPRTGEVEYSQLTEAIGNASTPDLVTDNGNGTITFRVNSATLDGGVSHAGRQVRVWLKNKGENGSPGPQTTVEGAAIEVRTVQYVGGHNVITTAGSLGQTTPSTNPLHYKVQVMGPTVVRRATLDLRAHSGTVFLAAVTSVAAGQPITVISTADQRVATFSLTDMGDVVRRDSHNSIKIRVHADSSDADEPQIEVYSAGGVAVFSVDEDGDVTVSGSLDAAAAALVTLGVSGASTFDGAVNINNLLTVAGDVVINGSPDTTALMVTMGAHVGNARYAIRGIGGEAGVCGNGMASNGVDTGGTNGVLGIGGDGAGVQDGGPGVCGLGGSGGTGGEGVFGRGRAGKAGVYGENLDTGPGVKAAGNTARGALNLIPQTNPSAPGEGDVWLDSATHTLRFRSNGVTYVITATPV